MLDFCRRWDATRSSGPAILLEQCRTKPPNVSLAYAVDPILEHIHRFFWKIVSFFCYVWVRGGLGRLDSAFVRDHALKTPEYAFHVPSLSLYLSALPLRCLQCIRMGLVKFAQWPLHRSTSRKPVHRRRVSDLHIQTVHGTFSLAG